MSCHHHQCKVVVVIANHLVAYLSGVVVLSGVVDLIVVDLSVAVLSVSVKAFLESGGGHENKFSRFSIKLTVFLFLSVQVGR